MDRRAKRQGNTLIAIGMVLLIAALGLVAYNFMGDRKAGNEARSVLDGLKEIIAEGADGYDSDLEEVPDYVRNPDMELPRAKIGSHECVGIIQLPTINIELPVIADYVFEEMLAGPCRFFGSPYTQDLVLCAHNYDTHFRRIGTMQQGDPVIFVDMDGNVFNYKVGLIEVLKPTDVVEMCDSEWDLSLFTCTLDAQNRTTVRCIAEDNDAIIQDLE